MQRGAGNGYRAAVGWDQDGLDGGGFGEWVLGILRAEEDWGDSGVTLGQDQGIGLL